MENPPDRRALIRELCAVLILGVLPKMGALVESLPTVVLGGAGLVMFGMVTATGIRILGGVDFRDNRANGMIVAVCIGVGMIGRGNAVHDRDDLEGFRSCRLAAIAAFGRPVSFPSSIC